MRRDALHLGMGGHNTRQDTTLESLSRNPRIFALVVGSG